MPAYIHQIHIDWHVADMPPELLPVIAKGNDRLDSTDHTVMTFEQQLRALAAANPGLVVDALIDDGYNSYVLLRARGGDVTTTGIEEWPEGATGPVDLPYDDLPDVGDDDFETYYNSESELRAAIANVRGSGGCVVEAGNDRFVVEGRADGATATKLVVLTQPALVAHPLPRTYEPPPRAG